MIDAYLARLAQALRVPRGRRERILAAAVVTAYFGLGPALELRT